jgi:hypothetical protein
MFVSVLEKNQTRIVDAPLLGCALRLGPEQIESNKKYLHHCIDAATDHLQSYVKKSMLTQKLKVRHTNNIIILPFGPVKESDIITVKRKGKGLTKNQDYTIECHGDTQKIITPFSWKVHALEVEYHAGHGRTVDDVPLVYRNSILSLAQDIFLNKDIDNMTKRIHSFVGNSTKKYALYASS